MASKLIKNLFCHMQKSFLQSSATLSSNSALPTTGTCSSSSSFTVECLVNSCGLSLESAISVSKKFQLNENKPQGAQSVVQFFKSHNFSDTQVAKVIVKFPKILCYNVEATLRPKFDYLVENGIDGELLTQLIVSNWAILRCSLDSQIKPSFELLRLVLDSEDKIIKVIKRGSWLLTADLKVALQPKIDFLRKEGMPANTLENFITWHPRIIVQKHERLVYAVNALKNLSFEPTTRKFVRALRTMMQMSKPTWNKKIEFMKRVGWDEEQILLAFKRQPLLLACSEEKIKKALNFYTNTMNLDPHFVISDPMLLLFSIENRIIPRYNVLKVLESEKLIPRIKNKTVSSLKITEETFMKNYVLKYMVEVPGLLEMYPGAEKFLKKFIDKFKGDVPSVLQMYPCLKNSLRKYFEK